MKTPRDESGCAASAKRARIGHEEPLEDIQMKGSVLKVKMRNFMTYGYVDFVPGTRLNLILGPNGTGKSSFVCAMCIGLAGKPSLLGRGDKVSEFIKRGEEFGEVEIKLCTGIPERPLIVYRKIKKDNTSDWKLNGQNVGQKEVEKKMKELNVQLDNLCQFLPQDRVVAFSQLKPTELLLETEKAIGDAELLTMHNKLQTMRTDIRGLATRVEQHGRELQRLRDLNKGLERDAMRVTEKNRLLAMEEDLRKKLPWLKFEAAKEKWEETRGALKECKKLLLEKEKEMEKVTRPLEEAKQSWKKEEQARKQAQTELVQADTRRTSLDERLMALNNDADQVADNMRHLEHTIADREAKISKVQAELDALNQQIEEVGPPPDTGAEMEALKLEIRQHTSRLKELMMKKQDLAEARVLPQRQLSEIQQRITQLDNVRNQRIQSLARQDNRIVQAYEWVQANKQQCKGPVYGPILAEVHVDSPQVARYLEQHCPNFLWSAFVTTHDDDLRLLRDKIGKVYGVSVINYPGDPNAAIPRPPLLDTLAKYDITGTLDMCYDAPGVVKHVLKDQAGTSRAFVGSQKTDQAMDQVIEVAGVQCVWTPSSQYTITKSRYSDDKSSRVVETRPCKLFTSSASQVERENLQQRQRDCEGDLLTLQQQEAQCQEQYRALENGEAAAARRKQETLTAQRADHQKRVSKLRNQQVQRNSMLQGLRAQMTSDQERAKLRAKQTKVTQQRYQALFSLHECLVGFAAKHRQFDSRTLRAAELEAQVAYLRTEVSRYEAEGGNLKAQFDLLQRAHTEEKQNALHLKQEAERVATLPDPELEAKFEEMPSTVQELEERLREIKNQVAALFVQDPNALQEYEDRKRKIEALELSLEEETATLEKGEGGIDELKQTWLEKLKAVVDKMNQNFSESFRAIGCVGELSLQEHQDFAQYEMRIRVKFRAEEEMQTLSSHRQSGGERSVSTMMYLIALQQFTKCPFRVVDEINQGMDAVNERKVFMKMVEAACRPDTPQCFLLTPKLLPQLDYSPAVTILNIMNGPRIKEVASIRDQNFKFYLPSSAHV